MNVRSIGKIMLIVLATVLVAASCAYDYWLDFELGAPSGVGSYTISVPYWMQNYGSREMDNAAIHIAVTINGGMETQDAWTEAVSLAYGEISTGQLDFLFVNEVTSATAVVIGARWDEAGIDY